MAGAPVVEILVETQNKGYLLLSSIKFQIWPGQLQETLHLALKTPDYYLAL